MKPQKYKVRLLEEERTELLNILIDETRSAKQKTRANVLLGLDWHYYSKPWIRPQECIASQCGVSTTTVYTISKQYVEEGFHAAINRKKRREPPVASILTSEKEAKIIALACSTPPEGYTRWTFRLLEMKAAEVGGIGRISDTTIGRVLKKYNVRLMKSGGSPTQSSRDDM